MNLGYVAFQAEHPVFDRAMDAAADQRLSVLIADCAGSAPRLSGIAAAMGQRVLGVVSLSDLAARLGRTIALDLLLLDLRGMGGSTDGQALALHAERERAHLAPCRLIVLFDPTDIDWVVAAFSGPECELLCAPDLTEIVAALAMADVMPANGSRAQLCDVSRDADPSRLDMLSAEVRRLASTIERLAGGSDGGRWGEDVPEPARAVSMPDALAGEPAGGAATVASPLDHLDVRALIRARRLRDRFFPAEVFADPAWDMMLDLLAARLAEKRVSVSSLCIAAAVPPTTALRWIRQLTDRGIFLRIDDPADGRRVFIELSDDAARALMAWATVVRESGGVLAA